jgi:hypothetical protein
MEQNFSILNGQEVSMFYNSVSKKYVAKIMLRILGSETDRRVEGDTIEDALQNLADWYSRNKEKIVIIAEME